MHHRVIATAAVFLALGAASAAHAQERGKIGVWLGTARLQGGFSRALVGSSATDFNVSLPAPFAEAQLSPDLGRVSLDIGYSGASRSGNSVRAFSIELAERLPMGRAADAEEAARRPYFGLAFGLAQVATKVKVTIIGDGQTTTATLSDSKLGIAYRAVVGMSIGQNAFIEGGYRWLGKALNVSADNLGLGIGVRF